MPIISFQVSWEYFGQATSDTMRQVYAQQTASFFTDLLMSSCAYHIVIFSKSPLTLRKLSNKIPGAFFLTQATKKNG